MQIPVLVALTLCHELPDGTDEDFTIFFLFGLYLHELFLKGFAILRLSDNQIIPLRLITLCGLIGLNFDLAFDLSVFAGDPIKQAPQANIEP